MPDNTTLNTGTGGDTIASDDIGGVKFQRNKLIYGADGVNSGDVSTTNPLPVTINSNMKKTYIVPINRLVNVALAANTTRQQISIEHALSSTKTVRLRRIHIGALNTTAVAGDLRVFIDYGTAASSAGTVITAQPVNAASSAAECVAKSLPTIVAATTKLTCFVGSVPATANSSIVGIICYDWKEAGESEAFTLRAGVLESLVIGIQSFGLNVYHLTGYIELTEE